MGQLNQAFLEPARPFPSASKLVTLHYILSV